MAAEATAPAADAPVASPEAADRAALIAELDAAEDAEGEQESPAPKARKGQSDESNDSDPEPSDDADADEPAEEGGDEEAEEGEAFQTPDEFREHLQSLIKEGDLRKVEEALGLEKGALKVNGAKLRYVQKTVAEAERKSGEAANTAREAENLKEAARNFYGPYVQAKQSFQSGTPQGVMQAARAVESHFGVPLAVFVEHVLKAGKGEASAVQHQQPQNNAETEALKAELAQIKNLLQNGQQQQQTAAAEQRHLATIGTKLKGTELSKLKDGPALVYQAIKGSYDQNLRGYALDLPKAIKAVLADPATKWKLHELKSKNGSAPAVTVKNGKGSPVKRVATVSTEKLSREEREQTEKARLIAELEAEERQQERAARRKRG